ncbi:hypothetical protein SDC9_123690 [bioreactor metagenome]|uniref:Uncharacterized protein n=1 Tax=bioreactor metagenome TaxID=1076179 RepID=A0A645CIB5_9ZZZZ
MGDACQKIGRSRRDHDQIGGARQVDMRHGIRHTRIPLIEINRFPGQRLESSRRHEMGRPFGHRHLDLGPLLAQQANQFGCLVGGNSAGYAKDDALTI